MKITDLMQEIKTHKFKGYHTFFGDEYAVMNIYISMIEKCGYHLKYVDTISQVLNDIRKKSLTNEKFLYIVFDDSTFQKAEEKWEQVKEIMNHSKHLLIGKYPKIAKTTKFYKQNEDCTVEFEKLSKDVLVKYIKKDLPELKEKYCEELVEICEYDYGRILLEINKIKTYRETTYDRDDYKDTFDTCYKKLLSQNIIHRGIGDITFKLTDAVLLGDLKQSEKYLYQAKQKGEPTLMILSILYDTFRNMLLVQGLGKDKHNASERTGLTGWQVHNVMSKIGGYTINELINNLRIIQKVEFGIKSGTIEESFAMDYTILSILF